MKDTRETIERQIFNLRKRVSLFLAANEPEQANRLLDQIAQLEGKKQNLRKPGGTHER